MAQLITDDRQFERVDQFIRSRPPAWQRVEQQDSNSVAGDASRVSGDSGDEDEGEDWSFFDTVDPPDYVGDWLSTVGAGTVEEDEG